MMWFAEAPANIALIKYMGKKDETKNIPDNPSLSYTLPKLVSYVQVEPSTSVYDRWEPLTLPGALPFMLSQKGQQRFLNHVRLLKNHFGFQGSFIIRSCNNFPHSSGLASSASSFAALTKCLIRAINEIQSQPETSIDEQAQLSRLGSGSSCRSFYAPWVQWEDASVKPIELPYSNLIHQVILISHAEKEISSSRAHQYAKTSPLYAQRSLRATASLKLLKAALESKQWHDAYLICWREFQDMHQLFSSASPSFSYINNNSQQLLSILQDVWTHKKDGPIVTMDAGPNIHLLYREDQHELSQQFKTDYLVGNFDVL